MDDTVWSVFRHKISQFSTCFYGNRMRNNFLFDGELNRWFLWIANSFVCPSLTIFSIHQFNFIRLNSENFMGISTMMAEFAGTVTTVVKSLLFVYHRKDFQYLFKKITQEFDKGWDGSRVFPNSINNSLSVFSFGRKQPWVERNRWKIEKGLYLYQFDFLHGRSSDVFQLRHDGSVFRFFVLHHRRKSYKTLQFAHNSKLGVIYRINSQSNNFNELISAPDFHFRTSPCFTSLCFCSTLWCCFC